MSYMDLKLEDVQGKYDVVDGKLVLRLSEARKEDIQKNVFDALRMGDFTADVIRFSTEGLVQVCLGLLNPAVKPNRPKHQK